MVFAATTYALSVSKITLDTLAVGSAAAIVLIETVIVSMQPGQGS